MGDSETVMAENSIVTEYPPANYTPIEYNEANSVPTAEGGDTATVEVPSTYTPIEYNPASSVATGETVDMSTEPTVSAASVDQTSVNTTEGVIYTVPDGSGLGVQSSYSADPNSAMQEAPVESTHVAEPEVGVAAAAAVANAVSQENAVTAEPAQASLYDSSVNGNGVSEVSSVNFAGHDVNGIASNEVADTVPDQQYDAGPLSTEEERLWSIVKTNSLDFSAWTALIEETEKVAEDNILKIRKLYDTFLAEFPLCYGYWKKYADHEARLGSIEKVVEVYERAVGAVTYSVDIWLHYCVFAMSTYGGDPDTVRRLFERGLAYVGTDYLSYPLWDKYIEYEFSQQEWCHLATIYTRILENPNQQLDRYFNSFRELAGSRPLSELRTNEEAAAMVAANAEDDGQGVESEVHPDGAEHSLKPISDGLTEAEELEKYVAIREEIYKKTKEFDSKIIGFETAIRRPYFHVRPLNGSELENWHNYLDFIESGDDFNKVVKLYERCLIACANYPEHWIRYVLCMEASGSIDLATNALARATQVFVKRQPEIHLFAARFKEKIGDTTAARAAYQLVHSGISPGLLEAIIKHANMEYRLGHKEEAFSLYEQAIATERGKEHSQTLPILFIQYSRFQMLVAGNAEKAREILDGAVESVQLSKSFLEGLIQLESLQLPPKRINYIGSLVEKFIMPNSDNPNSPSTTDREDISSIYLEFLDLFGDGKSIQKAADRHAKLFLSHRSTSELKKRSAEDYLASEKNKLAKAYNVSSPAQSVMGAYPNAQNQWPAGYAVQPQAYVQAPQAQGQQWNPAYAQQAAYSGYSGYNAAYTQPQVPVSAPQSTAYNAYPTSYPTQTFPQQSYAAQPATAVAFPPVQPQAQVSQAYYGNYY